MKPVKPPAELVGKWRHEVADEKDRKVSVYQFFDDGRFEVESTITNPDRAVSDLVKRAVVKVDDDKVTVVDLSRTGSDGVEEPIPPARRRERTYRVKVKGDELTWTLIDEQAKSAPTPQTLKRVKDN